jgi:catechol 2,3-dioxygenase-like lactoylglutathione lyase family enzyme
MDASILGVRHVKVWVTDLSRSRKWYTTVFDLEQTVEFEDSDGVVRGVGYRVRGTSLSIMLREDARMAAAMNDADPFALAVRPEALGSWARRLDELQIWHTPAIPASGGEVLGFRDPDGMQIRLYAEDHSVEGPAVFRASAPSADRESDDH